MCLPPFPFIARGLEGDTSEVRHYILHFTILVLSNITAFNVPCIQERVDELFEQIGVKSPDGLVITFSNFVNFVRLRDADLRVMFDEVRGATALVALSAHIADSKCTHVLFHPG